MPNTSKCKTCKGSGKITALVSMHDDVTEIVVCPRCDGRKVTHHMTDEEERDYKENQI